VSNVRPDPMAPINLAGGFEMAIINLKYNEWIQLEY
jgi:hypothetical protein